MTSAVCHLRGLEPWRSPGSCNRGSAVTTTAAPSHSPSFDENGWDRIIVFLVTAAGLVIAYLLIWPLMVWIFAGAALGLSAMTLAMAHATRGTPGPRGIATVVMLLSSATLLIAAWWTLHGGPGSDLSFAHLEGEIAALHPAYGNGIEGRWEVTTTHPVDIFSTLGMRGCLYVLLQVGAVAMAATLAWARASELSGWLALHNLQRSPKDARLIEQAIRFKELGAPAALATVIASIAICVVTGGWAHSWLEQAQERQFDAITDNR